MLEKDATSNAVRHALDALLTRYPDRTAIGTIFGIFLVSLLPDSLPWYGGFSLGLLVFHARTIYAAFFTTQVGNEELDILFRVIESSNFTKAERRQQYRAVVRSLSNAIALNKDIKLERDDVINEEKLRASSSDD